MIAMMRLLDRLTRTLMHVATTAGILLTGFVVLSSVMRYLMEAPFAFTEEIVGLLFAAMIFLAIPYCTLKERHICVTIVHDRLKGLHRRISGLAASLLIIAFAFWFGWLSFNFAEFSYEINSMTEMGGIILYPWMGLMPLSALLMAIATALLWVRKQLGTPDNEPRREGDP